MAKFPFIFPHIFLFIIKLIGCTLMDKQLVQFLLKQAGVDKRTGDLYGNRDLLNIARNMARGLKVGYILSFYL